MGHTTWTRRRCNARYPTASCRLPLGRLRGGDAHAVTTRALQELERFLERARNVQPVCDIYNRDGCDLEQCSLQVNELMREAQLRFEASDEEVWDKMYHLETLLEEMELHSSDADEDLEAPSTPVTPKNTTADLTAQSVLAPSKEDKQLSPV
mmetsp:Transcript_490/g.1692  ORF Transcript_490/g.1692 Transcript_490/m.1692 type:complete len:152 (+) Transcript_490:573-1028(+)